MQTLESKREYKREYNKIWRKNHSKSACSNNRATGGCISLVTELLKITVDDYIRACRTTPKTDVQMFNFQKTKQEIEIFFKRQSKRLRYFLKVNTQRGYL